MTAVRGRGSLTSTCSRRRGLNQQAPYLNNLLKLSCPKQHTRRAERKTNRLCPIHNPAAIPEGLRRDSNRRREAVFVFITQESHWFDIAEQHSDRMWREWGQRKITTLCLKVRAWDSFYRYFKSCQTKGTELDSYNEIKCRPPQMWTMLLESLTFIGQSLRYSTVRLENLTGDHQ